MKINFVDILLILLLLMCFVVALFFVTGCATTEIDVTKPDGTRIHGKATAILGADQKGIDVTKDGEDWLFEMEHQRSEADVFLQGFELGKMVTK